MFIIFCRRQLLKRLGEEVYRTLNTDSCTQETCVDTTPGNKGMYNNEKKIRSVFCDGTDKISETSSSTELSKEYCEDNNTLVIDNTGRLDTGRIEECLPEGRCILDFSYMWIQLHQEFDNHARGIECQFRDFKLVQTLRHGLLTQFFFKCQMCNYETYIWSEAKSSENLCVNTAAVAGTITVGIGYAQLKEQCAAMNISCMSEPTYIKYRDIVVEDFQKTALENMKMAAEVEKQLAVQRNDVINGIPYIPVIADGSWMKRSYGNAYNSLSGMGAIIGYHTKKAIFVGVRNKYCVICDMAKQKSIEPKAHKCYQNFDRNASSTSMESDVITEGFKCSLEMYGLIYKTMIADGDSSVYQSIRDNNPYREQMITVKKIECTNHLLCNLCKKLKVVAEMTQPKTHRQRGFVQIRNVVKSNILKIRQEVEKAAEVRRKEQKPQHCKATELQKDILNIPSHVFGEHKRCETRGRTCRQNENAEKNYVPFLKTHGLYQKIESAIKYLSGYSDSLILNYTNNPAESFNSIICKEIGGKRINFGKRGSYNARVSGAVVQYNTQQVLTELHKSMCKTVPPVVENLEKQRQIKVAKTKECRQTQGRPKKFKRESGTDSHYGPRSQRPDLSPERIEQLRQNHLEKLSENAEDWQKIELETRNQSESELWLSLRREMLTASNFGTVCRMRPTTSCAATVKAILYPSFVDTAAMTYGRDNEKVARKELAKKLKKEIKSCGLFIDTENPCLGASPDGVIDDGLVEIKCPLSAENVTAEEAMETIPSLKGIYDKKNPHKMNENHRYYYQVQGQLNITKREYCVFALWTPKSIKIIHVNRDIAFWKNKMLPFLIRFYNECLLPEILDSRYNRHMEIRNPRYILEAKREAIEKSNSRKGVRPIAVDSKNVNMEKNKICDISLTESTINTAIIVQDIEQDDCTYIGTRYKEYVTEEDKTRARINLDEAIIPLDCVRENVLSNNLLNDDSLDSFLRVVRETTLFQTQSVQYQGCHPDYIDASQSDKNLQIIGGKSKWTGEGIEHWRCIFFDGTKLHVYDSIPGCTYDKLVAKEKNYIHCRYPKIKRNDIIFEKVDFQPDSVSCGIYSAAFATTVALGGNPCNVQYSKDVKCMRQHFMKIIESNKLLPFPVR